MQKLLKAGLAGLWCVIAMASSFVLLFNSIEPRFYERLIYPLIRSLRKRRATFAVESVSSGRPSFKKNRVGYWYDQKHRQMIRLRGIFSQFAPGPSCGF